MSGKSEAKELVVDAAECSIDNVYFIGPYASRVSFASQQQRVLNLIFSLKEGDKTWPIPRSERPVRAIVVGGGIAGVMAVAALKMLDCDITLIEKEGHVLNLQEAASHRHVHPTISFWPYEPLRWTTRLPFFDWYTGSSDQVMRMLSKQWDDEISGYCRPIFNSPIKKIRFDARKQEVVVTHKKGTARADIVFVATGFGQEDNLGDRDQRPYWMADEAYRLVTSDETLLVSGTGDGGIIDALRLTYRQFMEKGVALNFLLAIDNDTLRNTVKRIEHDALKKKDLNVRAAYYAKEYRALAESRAPAALDKLGKPHKDKPKVVLVGLFDHPFEAGSAPIHKIILAYSLAKEWVEYRKGRLERVGGRYVIAAYDETTSPPTRLTESPVTEKVVVVRHGATPPIAKFIGADEANALKAKQQNSGNLIHLDAFKPTYFDEPGRLRSFGRNSLTLARSRLRLADRFMRDNFNGCVEIDLRGSAVATYSARSLDRTGFNHDAGPFPEDLFNVEVVPASEARPHLNSQTDHLLR